MAGKRSVVITRPVTEAELNEAIKKEKNPRVLKRLIAIKMIIQGLSAYKVSEILNVHPTTVSNWVKRFNNEGIKGLRDRPRPGRPPKAKKEEIDKILKESPRKYGYDTDTWTVKVLHACLAKQLGVYYHPDYVYRLIKRYGYTLVTPRPAHTKRPPEEVRKAFKKNAELIMRKLPIFAADESRKMLATVVRKVIAKVGSKPSIKVSCKREGIFVFVALNLITREVFVYFAERVNKSSVSCFLRAFSRFICHAPAYLMWDNHRAHVCRDVRLLAERLGITLIQMPPYSPDLNPVEEIFRELKAYLANRLFFSVEELVWCIRRFFAERGFMVTFDPANWFG